MGLPHAQPAPDAAPHPHVDAEAHAHHTVTDKEHAMPDNDKQDNEPVTYDVYLVHDDKPVPVDYGLTDVDPDVAAADDHSDAEPDVDPAVKHVIELYAQSEQARYVYVHARNTLTGDQYVDFIDRR